MWNPGRWFVPVIMRKNIFKPKKLSEMNMSVSGKPLVAPSMLSADFGNLHRDCAMIERSMADWYHIDVMDGLFVPNISFGFPVLTAISAAANKPLDVHLMIMDPDRYVRHFAEAGASVLTVHAEACTHLHRSLQTIRSFGMKAGVALNPHTPLNSLEYLGEYLDLVLIMSVNPGFGGQKFIPDTYKKISETRALLNRIGSQALIEVDGGVSTENAARLVEAGADVLVAGNAVFKAEDPEAVIRELKTCA